MTIIDVDDSSLMTHSLPQPRGGGFAAAWRFLPFIRWTGWILLHSNIVFKNL